MAHNKASRSKTYGARGSGREVRGARARFGHGGPGGGMEMEGKKPPKMVGRPEGAPQPSSHRATPAVPATPATRANPGVSPAIPATRATPAAPAKAAGGMRGTRPMSDLDSFKSSHPSMGGGGKAHGGGRTPRFMGPPDIIGGDMHEHAASLAGGAHSTLVRPGYKTGATSPVATRSAESAARDLLSPPAPITPTRY